MRDYFDDEQPASPAHRHEPEVRLGAGAFLAIGVGLLIVCGFCFGLGYEFGRRAPAQTVTTSASQTAAPDQEPLQASGAIPKPSASEQAPLPQPAPGADGTTPATASGTTPATQTGAPATGQQSTPAGAPNEPQPQVRPALPATTVVPPQPAANNQLMVQVAAVSHIEDADVLVGALRKRGYTVTSQREPSDSLIHVRIGPFSSRDEANRMCRRLLDDGYNAMVQ